MRSLSSKLKPKGFSEFVEKARLAKEKARAKLIESELNVPPSNYQGGSTHQVPFSFEEREREKQRIKDTQRIASPV